MEAQRLRAWGHALAAAIWLTGLMVDVGQGRWLMVLVGVVMHLAVEMLVMRAQGANQ